MSAICQKQRDYDSITFVENECSDGMCCFTCVIPSNNGHIGFFKSLWKKGTGYPYVKLLVTSEGYKDELYDSCRFLNFSIFANQTDSSPKMDLRCSIYKHRPDQCMGYPDEAGESLYKKISGPCIFNEYTASGAYKKLVYKREWQAFFAIRDDRAAMRNIFVSDEDVSVVREKILKTKDVHLATLSVDNTEELDYILIPVPRQTHNILYLSKEHKPIGTIRQAYHKWQEKIQKNLENHYGPEWETKLKNAIETEEKDAC
ncbi:MAG: hypothetical protein HRF42_00975 [Candidatus Brocadia sp.]|jgi:Fe-S-cluster containining protein